MLQNSPELPPESPQWDQENHHSLLCDVCGCEDIAGGDDGFFYCSQCGSQSQNIISTQTDVDDIFGDGGGGGGAIYSIFHSRVKSRRSVSPSKPNFKLPSKEEILRSLAQLAPKKESVESFCEFEDGISSLRDFGSLDCRDPARAVGEMRLRYIQGLQLMLQLQCEALVEKFGVSPMICGMAMSIWLRYVAVSRVFDDGWVERMVGEAKTWIATKLVEEINCKDKQEIQKKSRSNFRMGETKTFGQKVINFCFRSLRRLVPVYSTLAISFLSCHLAREAVLPTDIYKWVSEANLPYLSAFTVLEKLLGPPKFCSLNSRLMFRPIRVISASLLEATAASIAQSIGLRTPSVNFYAIARRYLKALSLPVAKIVPQACHLYEWSLPSELWLSSCNHAFPTRVYVMAILIVAIRILYNLHGHGIWEKSVIGICNSSSSFGCKHHGAAQEVDAAEPSASNGFPCCQKSEFCLEELLQILDMAYHRMNTTHEYSKDLRSYLKYCGDVIFAGLTPSYEEGKLIGRLWDLYDKKENDDQHTDEETNFFELKVKRPRVGESTNSSMNFNEVKEEKQDITRKKVCTSPNSAITRSFAIQHLKFDMEDNGFQYLPPRRAKMTNDYLHYRRQKIDGNLIYVAHADYYILLRACAKLSQVDTRILHVAVLRFESRLNWIEQRIDQSLNLLHKCSVQDGAYCLVGTQVGVGTD